MFNKQSATVAFAAALLLAASASAPNGGARAAAEEASAYNVEIPDLDMKVGQSSKLIVTARINQGYRILKGYKNRMIKLSAYDDGVAFDDTMVPAELEDGALVFSVGVKAVKPGKHAINALLRVGFIHGEGEMSMVSLPVIAHVTGAE